MADRNPIEADLAQTIHKAEYAVAQANAAPAGNNRIERICKADADLLAAEDAYEQCLSGRGYKR